MRKRSVKTGDLFSITDTDILKTLEHNKAVYVGDGDEFKSSDSDSLAAISSIKLLAQSKNGVGFYTVPLSKLKRETHNLGSPDFGTPVVSPDGKSGICLSKTNHFLDDHDMAVYMLESKDVKFFDDYDLSVRML